MVLRVKMPKFSRLRRAYVEIRGLRHLLSFLVLFFGTLFLVVKKYQKTPKTQSTNLVLFYYQKKRYDPAMGDGVPPSSDPDSRVEYALYGVQSVRYGSRNFSR